MIRNIIIVGLLAILAVSYITNHSVKTLATKYGVSVQSPIKVAGLKEKLREQLK